MARMRILWPSTIWLIALAMTPSLLFHFDVTPKILVILAAAAAALLFFCENLIGLRVIGRSQPGFWFLVSAIGHLAAIGMATAWSTIPLYSVYGTTWRRFGLISSVAVTTLAVLGAAWTAGSIDRLKTLLRSISFSGGLLSLYCIFQYFGLDPWLPAKAYSAGEGKFTIVRPPGTFGHADYFGGWLLFVVFGSLALARTESTRRARWAVQSVAGAAAFSVVLTGTRGALLGLAGGLMVFLMARFRLTWRRYVGVIVLCIGVLGAFIASPAGSKLRARAHWSRDDWAGGARLLLWRDSLVMIAGSPLRPFGAETFSTQFPRHESVALARSYPDFFHESPHNALIDELMSGGGAGLVFFVAMATVALWAGWRAIHGGFEVAAPIVAGTVAILLSSQFIVLIPATAFALYLLEGILVGLTVPRVVEPVPRARMVACGFASATVAILFMYYGVRLAAGDFALARAQRCISKEDVNCAARWHSVSKLWRPPGASDDLLYSRQMASLSARSHVFLTQLTAWREAFESAVGATQLAEDRQNAWYHLAILYGVRNDAGGVERCLRNAIAWSPNWFKPHWMLAQLNEKTGRHQQALVEANRALELDGGAHPEVQATALAIGRGASVVH